MLVRRSVPSAVALFLAAFSQFAVAATSTTALTSSTSVSILGLPVTFNTTVSPQAASGHVTFYDGVIALASKSLSGGQASFTTSLLGFGYHSITAIYNGDGVYTSSVSPVISEVVRSEPANGLVPASRIPNISEPGAITIADFNGDGLPDIALLSSDAANVLLGRGDGSFQSLSPLLETQPYLIATADFNEDGFADLAIENSYGYLTVQLGKGDGTFPTSQVVMSNGGQCAALYVVDFNRDGHPDIGCSLGNILELFLGNGDGTFTPAQSIQLKPVAVADFNGDEIPDLVTLSNSALSVYLGNGDGSFAEAPSFSVESVASLLLVADLDNDGRPDMIVSSAPGGTSLQVLLGNGDGTFRNGPATGVLPVGVQIASADVDGDGATDLIAGAGKNSIAVYAGKGNGTFMPPVFYSNGDTPLNFAVGDFNADGKTDLVFSGLTPNFSGDVDVMLGASTGVCATITPPAIALDDTAQMATFTVATSYPSCEWTVSTPTTWIQPVPSGYLGDGTVSVQIAQNTTGQDRSGTLTAAGQAIIVNQAATTQVFSDVPPSDYYFDAVNELSAKSVTAGCGSGTYCPAESVTRDQMAVFLIRMIYSNGPFSFSPVPYFGDVPANYWAFSYIQKLYELGITTGCGPALYCPTLPVARDQMAVFIIRARYGAAAQFDYVETPFFTDVPDSEFAFAWVQRLRMDSITSGCQPELYCPSNPVIRGDMAIFLMRGGFNQNLPVGEPAISGITPNTLVAGTSATFALTGVNTNWVGGVTQIAPIPGVTVGMPTVNSPTSMTVELSAAGDAPLQPDSVLAITGNPPGNEEAVLPSALTIEPASEAPTITSMEYSPYLVINAPITYNILINGTGFVSGATLWYCAAPPAAYVCFETATPTVVNWTTLTLAYAVFPYGSYQFFVSTPAGNSGLSSIATFTNSW